jgi:hypothetical protein
MTERNETPDTLSGLKWAEDPSGEGGGGAGSKGAMMPGHAPGTADQEPLRWVDESCGEGGAAGSKGAMLPLAVPESPDSGKKPV